MELSLAAYRNLNFSAPKYYQRATGEVIVRSPEGGERSLFTTPAGSTAGVIAAGPDGTLYMTSNGDEPGLWRLRIDGKAEKFVTLPRKRGPTAWVSDRMACYTRQTAALPASGGLILRAEPQASR